MDPDPGETFIFELIDNPGALFDIDGNHLVLNGALNFEAAASTASP